MKQATTGKKMNEKSAASLFKELAKNSDRPEIAKLRDIYDDVAGAIKAGASITTVFNGAVELGFTMTESSFKSALHRIRKERGLSKKRKKKGDELPPRDDLPPIEQEKGAPIDNAALKELIRSRKDNSDYFNS